MSLNKEEITQAVTEALAKTEVPRIREMIQEQIQETVSKINPAPTKEEQAVNEAVKTKKFSKFGEFLTAIARSKMTGHIDDRLTYIDAKGNITQKALSEGTDSAGGFLVEEIFQAELRQVGLENTIIRPNGAVVLPMTSDSLIFPKIQDTTHASSLYGGVIAYWTTEAATMTASQPVFGQDKLTAKELTGYTQASNNLLADSAITLEVLLKKMFGEAWAWFEDLAFIQGTGSGQPLGILNADCLVQVTRQDTDYVCIKDILNMYSRMLPSSRDRAVWIMNHEVLPALLFTVMENVETGSTSQTSFHPMFLKNIVDPVAKTILGRPYFVTEKMSAKGDAGDIGFFDLGYYLIGDRQALTIDASEHVAFTTNQMTWRFVLRVDGQPWLSSAITPYKGTATLSPFVTLSSTS